VDHVVLDAIDHRGLFRAQGGTCPDLVLAVNEHHGPVRWVNTLLHLFLEASVAALSPLGTAATAYTAFSGSRPFIWRGRASTNRTAAL
jgi:hypothetical protein